MKRLIQNIIYFFNLRISSNFKINKLSLSNVFNSRYNKYALISYITNPFTTGIDYCHSNRRACHNAAVFFHNQGYSVDVVDHSISKRINYSKYHIIYGMGAALERSFYSPAYSNILRVFYSTGCNPIFSDVKTTLRVREFYIKHKNLFMNSSRIIKNSQHAQIFLSDAVIVLGNNFVLRTYTDVDPKGQARYHQLNSFYNDVYNINLKSKDFSKAKKHFLWFGSAGLLHKGLDLLLDTFSKRKDIYLHVCGASPKEIDFFNYYKDLFSNSDNIFNHGFVKMESNKFKSIMNTCAYAIFPSVSEGGGTALLNVMANGGLVPIYTKSSGVDMNEFGWALEEPDIEALNIAINQAVALNTNELIERANKLKSHVRQKYTFENYKNSLTNILAAILKIKK